MVEGGSFYHPHLRKGKGEVMKGEACLAPTEGEAGGFETRP